MKYEDVAILFDYVGMARPFERAAYLNRVTEQSYITSAMGDSDELPDDIDDNADYLRIPHRNDLDLGKHLVFKFVGERLPDMAEHVYSMFQRPGAYGNFRDMLSEKGLLDEWNKYESNAVREVILEWCKENNVEIQG